MSRMRGVSAGALVGACSLFVLCGVLPAQETVDIAPARREILEALQRALQPSPAPLPPPRGYSEAPPPVPVDVDADATSGPLEGSLARIEYEVSIIHLAAPDDFIEDETSVSSETLPDLLLAWREAGRIAQRSTFRFSSVEQQEAHVQVAEQMPVVTGRSSFGGLIGGRGGPSQTSVNYRDVGTMIGCTGRLDGPDIVVDVQVEESRLVPVPSPPASSDAAGEVAEQDASETLQLQSTQQLRSQTTTVVPDGGTVVLSAAFSKTEEGAKGVVVTLKASTAP